jgi:arylsulfatase A-like enzyme
MMNTLAFVTRAAAAAVSVVAVLSATPSQRTDSAHRRPPNVLFIAIDDLNDWVEPLGGHPLVRTPHMNRLASAGTTFTNAHAQAPLCNPSRTSLMLGLRPSTTGIYGLAPWFRTVDRWKDAVPLPEYLRTHGYTTYSAGKVYHANYGRAATDHEFDVLGPPSSPGPTPPSKLANSGTDHPLVDWGTFPHRDEDKSDWKVASWAIDRLREPQPKPFFLSVGFFLPHVPVYVTQKWIDMYPATDRVLPPTLADDRADTPPFSWYLHWSLPEPRLNHLERHDEWRSLARSYLAATSFVDDQIGRLISALEASPYADNTVVVLWSDNGFHLGEKAITGKNSLWERSTRVPLMFAGPGVAAGSRYPHPVELLDVYPTLVDLLGLPAKPGLEGVSLAPQLRDPKAQRERPAITTHNPDNHAVRTDRWRYIRYADGSEELYDLVSDPNEWRNVAADAAFATVRAAHRRWLPERSAPLAPGSRDRILTFADGVATWEGKPIDPKAPVPGMR